MKHYVVNCFMSVPIWSKTLKKRKVDFFPNFTGKHAEEFYVSYMKDILSRSGKEEINLIFHPVIVKNVFMFFF